MTLQVLASHSVRQHNKHHCLHQRPVQTHGNHLFRNRTSLHLNDNSLHWVYRTLYFLIIQVDMSRRPHMIHDCKLPIQAHHNKQAMPLLLYQPIHSILNLSRHHLPTAILFYSNSSCNNRTNQYLHHRFRTILS